MTKRADLSLDECILSTIHRLQQRFYAAHPEKFYRDKRHLIRALTRFGYECEQRGWAFDHEKIFTEIATLLRKIEKHKADIAYLPAYLDTTITLYIRQRAEELSAENKRINNLTGRILNNLTIDQQADEKLQREHREKTTAVLATMFHVLKPKAVGRKEGKQLNFFRGLQ